MKPTINLLLGISLMLILFSCGDRNKHFIQDDTYRATITKQFEETKLLAAANEDALFAVFDTLKTPREKEALEFLYASMPLSDLADYDGDFFYNQMKMSFKAQDEMHWGSSIPDDIFRHFVLPYRVNNENLDSFRMVMYEELKARIEGMDMKKAAMEINHWCHEHVNYMGADSRTSSPLATIKNGRGRCGEESTLLVAALRTVAIPARQVYTPRWAHCDDNHAWVEIWAAGKWYFTGACEPAPQLNQGWFVEPARRAMLIHTKTFGMYHGEEECLEQEERYSNLNVLKNYAVTKSLRIQVTNQDGAILDSVPFSFGLYNYAEFYPIYSGLSRLDAPASFTTGFGDLGILASKDGWYAFQRVAAADTGLVTVILNHPIGEEYTESIDFIPPVPLAPLQSDTLNANFCGLKMSSGDSIRTARKASLRTFDEEALDALIIPEDKASWMQILQQAEANIQEVYSFILKAHESGFASADILAYLKCFNEKDLRDTPADILLDHLLQAPSRQGIDSLVYEKYVRQPRISNEMLGAYRSFLLHSFTGEEQALFRQNPENLVQWVKNSISILDKRQQYNVLATPVGVFKLRQASSPSRDVFLIASARTMGIPARLSESDLKPQLFIEGQWQTVSFTDGGIQDPSLSNLYLSLEAGPVEMPVHRTHYSLGRWGSHGFETAEYEFDLPFSALPQPYKLEPGYYRLITGNRVKDGKVLTRLSYFNLSANQELNLALIIREEQMAVDLLGHLKSDAQLLEFGQEKSMKLADLQANQAIILMYLSPSKEPSRHLIAEVAASVSILQKKNIPVLCLLDSPQAALEVQKAFHDLGNQVRYFQTLEKPVYELSDPEKMQQTLNDNPRLLFVLPDGSIRFFASGYQINMLESLLQKSL